MPRFHRFLRCVGKAVLKQGVHALLGLVPLGEQLCDIASEAISDYRQDCNDAQLHAEIAAAKRQMIPAYIISSTPCGQRSRAS